MNYIQIQEKLRNGMSIDEVCKKHHITFKELCDHFHGYQRNQQNRENLKSTKGEKYILIRNNRYALHKNVKGQTIMFGTYNTLEDAIRMREALTKDGWHQTHVDKLCEELGIERRKGFINEKVRYS